MAPRPGNAPGNIRLTVGAVRLLGREENSWFIQKESNAPTEHTGAQPGRRLSKTYCPAAWLSALDPGLPRDCRVAAI